MFPTVSPYPYSFDYRRVPIRALLSYQRVCHTLKAWFIDPCEMGMFLMHDPLSNQLEGALLTLSGRNSTCFPHFLVLISFITMVVFQEVPHCQICAFITTLGPD